MDGEKIPLTSPTFDESALLLPLDEASAVEWGDYEWREEAIKRLGQGGHQAGKPGDRLVDIVSEAFAKERENGSQSGN